MTQRLQRTMLMSRMIILVIQVIFMPIGMVLAEPTIDTKEQEQVELPPIKNYLKEPVSAPRFFFTHSRMQGSVGEPMQVMFYSDQEVSEVQVLISEEAKLIKEMLLAGISVDQGEHPPEWLFHSEHAQKTFVLPLVFDTKGSYEVSVEDESLFIDIIEKEVEEEPSKNESFEATESTDLDSKNDESNIKHNQEDTDEKPITTNTYGVANVIDWIGFIEAFSDPTITTIDINDDFEVPTAPLSNQIGLLAGDDLNIPGGATFVNLIKSGISRTLTINGHGNQIDFGSVSLGMSSVTHNANSPWDITFKDLDIYSGNWWGFFQTANLTVAQHTVSNITLHNINSYGNELIAPYFTNVNISGVVNNHITETYTSKFRTDWRVNTVESVNLETRSLNIKEDATLNLSTVNSGNIIIGLGGLDASLTLEKNATINLESNGTTTGANAHGLGASIDIVNGNLIMSEGSAINLNTTRSYSAIQLRSSGSNLLMEKNSKINVTSTGHTNSTNSIHRNLIYMGTGSSLMVENGAEFSINAINRGSANSHILNIAGDAQVSIGKDAKLNIKSDSTSNTQSLMYFASAESVFEFSDAKKVNLERTGEIAGTTNNGLINIAGSNGLLDIDVQSVKQWERGNFEVNPDFSWTPVFNLNLRYAGVIPTIDTMSSISIETIDSFKENFTTQNVQRVLFEKIPDVEISIDPLTEDPAEVNSFTVTGKATPNSYIRLSGDPAFPIGNIVSPNIFESEFYHTIADENGDYLYELPNDLKFTAGNTVVAYAFLNGKYSTARTIVEERRYIPPADPLKPEIEVDPENKPELPEDQGLLSIDFISSFNFGFQVISAQDQTYYAQQQRLLNEDSTVNEIEVRPNYVQISDRRPENERNGWQLAVTQKEQFKGEEKQELFGASLSLSNQQVITAQGGTAPGLQSVPCVLIPGSRRILLKAQGNEGTGTWVYRFGDEQTAGESIALNVPKGANPEATNYSTILIWELSAVPEN